MTEEERKELLAELIGARQDKTKVMMDIVSDSLGKYLILRRKDAPLDSSSFVFLFPAGSKFPPGKPPQIPDEIEGGLRAINLANDIDELLEIVPSGKRFNNIVRQLEDPDGTDVLNEINLRLEADPSLQEFFINDYGLYFDRDGNVSPKPPPWYAEASDVIRPSIGIAPPEWGSEEWEELNVKYVNNPEHAAALELIAADSSLFIDKVNTTPDMLVYGGTDIDKKYVPSQIGMQDLSFGTLKMALKNIQETSGIIAAETELPNGADVRTVADAKAYIDTARGIDSAQGKNYNYRYVPVTDSNGIISGYKITSEEVEPSETTLVTNERFLSSNFGGDAEAAERAANLQKKAMNDEGLGQKFYTVNPLYSSEGGIYGYEVVPTDELKSDEFVGRDAVARVDAYIAGQRPNQVRSYRLSEDGQTKIYFSTDSSDGSLRLSQERISELRSSGFSVTESLIYEGMFNVSPTQIYPVNSWEGNKAGKEQAQAWLKENDPEGLEYNLTRNTTTGRWELEDVDDYVGVLYTTEAAANRNVPEGFQTVGRWNVDGTQSWGFERIPEVEPPSNFDELVFTIAQEQGGAAALAVDAFRDNVNRKDVTLYQAAQLAFQYGKDANQRKQIMSVLMQPTPDTDMTAFDTAIRTYLGDEPSRSRSVFDGAGTDGVDVLSGIQPGGSRQTDALTAAAAAGIGQGATYARQLGQVYKPNVTPEEIKEALSNIETVSKTGSPEDIGAAQSVYDALLLDASDYKAPEKEDVTGKTISSALDADAPYRTQNELQAEKDEAFEKRLAVIRKLEQKPESASEPDFMSMFENPKSRTPKGVTTYA